MSLIACVECGGRISDKATSCPKCGAPISASLERPVTTQATAKKFKLYKLIAVVLVIIGAVSALIPETTHAGAGILLAGVALYIYARVRAWWHSG